MATDFTMPRFGQTMTEGVVLEWLVDDGALVEAGQPVLIIETDKVETEVEVRHSGVLRITAVVGEAYPCGASLASIEAPDVADTTGTPAFLDDQVADAPTVRDPLTDDEVPDWPPPEPVDAFAAEAVSEVEHVDSVALDRPVQLARFVFPDPEIEPAAAQQFALPELESVGGAPNDAAESAESAGSDRGDDVVEPVQTELELGSAASASGEVADEVVAEAQVGSGDLAVVEVEADSQVVAEAQLGSEVGPEDLAHRQVGAEGPVGPAPTAEPDGPVDAASADDVTNHEAPDALVEKDAELADGEQPTIIALDPIVPASVVSALVDPMTEIALPAIDDTPEQPEPAQLEQAQPSIPVSGSVGTRVKASPRARRLANERTIDLRPVAGTGPGGRIVYRDVIAHLDALASAEAQQLVAVAPVEPAPVEAAVASGEPAPVEVEAEPVEPVEPAPIEGENEPAEPVEPVEIAVAPGEPIMPGPVTPSGEEPVPSVPLIDLDASAPSNGIGAPSPIAVPPAADHRNSVDQDRVIAQDHDDHDDHDEHDDHGELADEPPPTVPPSAPPLVRNDARYPLLQKPIRVLPLDGLRGDIAERMQTTLRETAQTTLSIDVDMGGVHVERERRRAQGQTVPGYTAWVAAAAAQAIDSHQYVNSQVTPDGVAILPDVHLGVAVALEQGLVVPVIEHANLRTVEETHLLVADLAGRARGGELAARELEGATFSVIALGMFGIDMFTPILHPPNTAILGIGRLRSTTEWVNGAPTEKTVMTLSLTWDHRAFDSAPAAEFAQTIGQLLEEPSELV